MTQLIPSLVWKVMHNEYKEIYPNYKSQKDTLKDYLQNTLKVLKIRTFNEEGCERGMLQSGEILAQLKARNGHVIQNIVLNFFYVS
jgi:hypothetical protein